MVKVCLFILSCFIHAISLSYINLLIFFNLQKHFICRSFHQCPLLILTCSSTKCSKHTKYIHYDILNQGKLFSPFHFNKVHSYVRVLITKVSPFHFNKVHSCARVLITKVKKKTFMFLIKKRKRLNVVYNLFDKLQRKSFLLL